MEQKISYANYRNQMQELAFKKAKLNQIINKKRQKYAEYIAAHREYRKLMNDQDILTKELIELIPDTWKL